MRITRATLGMAPPDYATNCRDCGKLLRKARGDLIYHASFTDELTATLCVHCAGVYALEEHLTRNKIEAHEATARIIHESRSH